MSPPVDGGEPVKEKRKSRNFMISDAISEDLVKHDSIQIIEPHRERSGSSDTI